MSEDESQQMGTGNMSPAKDPKKQQMIIIVAVIVGVIIIAGGAWAGLHGKKGSTGTYGNLPLGGDKQATPTPEAVNRDTSGLSGMPCDHPNRRPIGVMLAGDPINRPLSGFSTADMVFELPVLVSDVTRLTAVYQCGEPAEIGSVRSARHNYLYLLNGIDGIMAHWGGSYWALNMIAAGEYQTMNALQNPNNAFFRKSNLPAPYNGFTAYSRLWDTLQKLGYRTETQFKGYDFKDDASTADRPAGGTLTIGWPGQFKVSYEYNPTTNRYERFWAGVKQFDGADKKLIAPSVVAVMRATNTYMDGPGGYNNVAIEGSGDLTVYEDGKAITGTWKKDANNKKDPVHFLDAQGKPITFTRGQVWIMAVEPTISVTWTAK
jgi:hypothetical protein